MRLHLIPDHGETYEQTVEQADLIAARLGVTDSSFEAHRVVLHLPDDLPPAPTSKPLAYVWWQPMSTCPRGAYGRPTEDVWIAYQDGRPPRLRQVGSSWLLPERDRTEGRFGWLPGNVARADLPPTSVLAPTPFVYAWRPMATCPRTAKERPREGVWISYSDGRKPLKHTISTVIPEDNARFGRVGWLPGYVDKAKLPPTPAPARQPFVYPWRPMSTCPREVTGRPLTENVWIAYSQRRPPRLWLASVDSWPMLEDDYTQGRLGWLPGHILVADLPPTPTKEIR